MEKYKVGVFCLQHDLRSFVSRRLSHQFSLVFPESIEEAHQLLEALEIQCLVVHPAKEGRCLFGTFDKLLSKNTIIPIIYIGKQQDCLRTEFCARSKGITCINWEEVPALSESVQQAIEQSQFIQQISCPSNNLSPRIKRALKYIHKNFTKIKSAEAVSSYLGIARSTFLNEFRYYCQVSFRDYLMNLKMQYAAYLSSFPNLKTKEIAQLCGYKNEFKFYRIFKIKMGVTFSEYRKQ